MIDPSAALDRIRQRRVVLAHDWLVGMRGGEQVLDRLCRLFGPTDLFTLVHDGGPLTPAIDECRIHTSPLQRFPKAAGSWRRHYLPLFPWAVGRLRVPPCDLVISTSSAVMKSIRPPAGAKHLCYCHSPARYIWEQSADYATGQGGAVRRAGLWLCGPALRRWDARTANRVDRYVANSSHTAARIERCFHRDAAVVHPPVRTAYFTPDESVEREDFLLVVAALEPYKRTDLVIRAAKQSGRRLKVVGSGSQLESLRALATSGGTGGKIEMLGRVDDESLRDLYRRAKALVFPQVEDFGIIPVEAMACGCPVVAHAAGGALDSVTADSGVLFEEQTPAAIIEAVERLEREPRDPGACRAQAERFSESAFDAAVIRAAAKVLGIQDD